MGILDKIESVFEKDDKKRLSLDTIKKIHDEPDTLELDRPTLPAKAKLFKYKNEQGMKVYRQRVRKGKDNGFVQKADYSNLAKKAMLERYTDQEIIGSYKLYEDENNVWFELIVVDKNPKVVHDPKAGQLLNTKRREEGYKNLFKR